jgi:DNA-binding transcriptional regulator LsrR (DeoR family)
MSVDDAVAGARDDSRRGRPPVSLEAAIVARRYFIDDKQKNEIAEELGLSRFKVARLIDEAKASGIVRIYVDMPAEVDVPLGEALERRYGVQRALVVRSVPRDPGATTALLGAAGAEHLRATLGPADVLGMSWGTSVTAVVDAVSELPPVDVVQMVGGVRSSGLDVSGSELVRRLTSRTSGAAYPLHAPLLVRSAGMAGALRTDPSLSDVIDRFQAVTVALVGIGSWNPPHSSLYLEIAPAERDALTAAGAVADVCGQMIDSRGQVVDPDLAARTIGITLDELRRVPTVIAVANGTDKTAAIAAALAGRLVSVLVTDSDTAEALLA